MAMVLLACDPVAKESDFAVQDAYRQPEVVLAALGEVTGTRVADVGAGGGYFALKLSRRVGPGGRVMATDVDARALRDLQQRAKGAGLTNLETHLVTVPTEPELEAGIYRAVLMAQVDHLLVNRVDYFRKVAGALEPRGVLVVVNQERYGEACEVALKAAGFTVERLALRGQMLLRARR